MRLHEAIVIPRQGSRTEPEPLRDDHSVRVYHGTPAPEVVLAVFTRGISGVVHVVRTYSYEQNNNPRGLFVSPVPFLSSPDVIAGFCASSRFGLPIAAPAH